MASSTSSMTATCSASLSNRLIGLPEPGPPPVEVPEAAEPVVFELEEPVRVVERLLSAGRNDRLYPWEHHTDMGAFTWRSRRGLSLRVRRWHEIGVVAAALRADEPPGVVRPVRAVSGST
jgi:hypothetical protein